MKGKGMIYFCVISSPVGQMAIVSGGEKNGEIRKIYLPRRADLRRAVLKDFPDAREADFAADAFKSCFEGRKGSFPLKRLGLKSLNQFQKSVLVCLAKVPAGRVISYARLAEKVGSPGAARAVGTAMAQNPFPIAIPCHRTVRSDGSLGGFGGGLRMKRALLEMERVEFDKRGRIKKEFFL